MKKFNLNFLFIFLILFMISLSGVNASARDVSSEEDYSNSDYNEVFDYESSKANDDSQNDRRKHSYHRRSPLELQDSAFASDKGVTLKNLVMRVSLILLFLLGVLAAVKMLLSRGRFDQVGSMFDEFAQKFTGNFSGSLNPQGLKLKQTLMLTPGQSIYLVEIEGKKLLLGGTHQGGVQFLADLTQKNLQIDSMSIRKSEEVQKELMPFQAIKDSRNLNSQFKHAGMFSQEQAASPFFASTMLSQSELEENSNESKELLESVQSESLKTNGNGTLHQKQPLKRRTSFRQSLLSEAKNGSLLRAK
ncbi:MAG: flagellar biosynthetic protein FliO [Candidatus Melainabacteria bacterium]|nr:flagellar biosynthetic protein FliO [Candidatus Melainabacteria bacterium]